MYFTASVPNGCVCTLMVVVGPFTEIKTGYRGFEMDEIRYFVCLLLALIFFFMVDMNQNLQLEMAFARY